MSDELQEKRLEAKARRAARRADLIAQKSRWRAGSIDNHGGFMLNDGNRCVYGDRWDLSAQEVIDICKSP